MSQANILIDENWHPQLADFGLTLFAENSHYNTTDQGGTMRYMAPELIHPDHFGMTYRRTYASDIYAYACLCIEVNIFLVLLFELMSFALLVVHPQCTIPSNEDGRNGHLSRSSGPATASPGEHDGRLLDPS